MLTLTFLSILTTQELEESGLDFPVNPEDPDYLSNLVVACGNGLKAQVRGAMSTLGRDPTFFPRPILRTFCSLLHSALDSP
jgi:hypothetical protein